MLFNLKAEMKIEFHCPKEHFSAVFEDRILRSHVSFVFQMFVKLKPKEREREREMFSSLKASNRSKCCEDGINFDQKWVSLQS
jgi:hypothetical protein